MDRSFLLAGPDLITTRVLAMISDVIFALAGPPCAKEGGGALLHTPICHKITHTNTHKHTLTHTRTHTHTSPIVGHFLLPLEEIFHSPSVPHTSLGGH